MNVLDWLTDPTHWSGPDGIPAQTLVHVGYSGLALVIAAVIALPAGIAIGVTGRGTVLVAGLANALRALPTVGLLILAVLLIAPVLATRSAFVIASTIVLVLLAVPPILTNTYAGIIAVDAAAVDAARGMGLRRLQVLRHVQLPCAAPLILSGLRSATLQIISTATIAAYVSLGGLGRYLIDGRAQSDYAQMAAGAVLVATLALLVELFLVGASTLLVSPGLTRRAPLRRRSRQPRTDSPAPVVRSA